MVVLAEKERVVREDHVHQVDELLLAIGALEHLQVVADRGGLGGEEAFAQTRGDQIPFLGPQADPAAFINQ